MAQLHLMTALYILSTRAEKVIRPLLILPGHIARLKARNQQCAVLLISWLNPCPGRTGSLLYCS